MRKCRRRKYSRRAKIGAVIFAVVIILFAAAVVKAEHSVAPAAIGQAEHYAKLTANNLISSAVADYLEENRCTYSDFAAVLYDETGKAVSIEAITYNINRVQSELSMKINSEFKSYSDTTAEIPLGSLTDSYLLAGKGPELRVRICPVGEAEVELTSSFSSAGVNQTCHRISAVVTAEINSAIPLYSFSTDVSFEFLIAENVIVGEVPDITATYREQ